MINKVDKPLTKVCICVCVCVCVCVKRERASKLPVSGIKEMTRDIRNIRSIVKEYYENLHEQIQQFRNL